MNKFVFDLVTQDGFYDFPEFNSQKEFEEYIGEEVPIKFDCEETILWEFEEKWKDAHKFAVLSDELYEYDLEKGYTIQEAIYTIDGKYYDLLYIRNLYDDSEVWQEPYEVYPIEETVTITRYVTKK